MTIEDEEMFMAVAMQMYMGVLFLAAVNAVQSDNMYLSSWHRHGGLHLSTQHENSAYHLRSTD